MPRLFVLSGPDTGRVFDVESGAKLGRAPDCDVQLSHSSVSRHHALLERDERGWCVVDAGSVNGVVFGGGRVGRAPLSDGAVFALGDVELRFRALIEVTGPGVDVDLDLDLTETTVSPRLERLARLGSGDDEIVLEEPDELELPAASAQPAAAPRPSTAPARAAGGTGGAPVGARRGATTGRAATSRAAATGERGVLQYQRVPDREGFFASDLAQQPAWVRFSAALLALCLFAALGYGAWRGVLLLRERGQPDALELESDG
jgi:hypothetical protein